MFAYAQHLSPPGDDYDDGSEGTSGAGPGFPTPGDDLSYSVEVWDASGEHVELVVAVTVTPVVGYSAYYAAAREYPGRMVTLRHRSAVISRWTGRAH